MTFFNPYWLGLDFMQDSPPGDGCAIMFYPSIANDLTAAVSQMESEASSKQFMQDNFRLFAMNMADSGIVLNAVG